MHFSTVAASVALFGASAMAGVSTYVSVDMITITSCAPEYTNCPAKTYTSSYHVTSTCTEEQAAYTTPPAAYSAPVYASSAPVYASSAPVYNNPTPVAVYSQPTVITYTSVDHVTITSCAAYVTNCPARTYHSTAYSTSTYSYCPVESSSVVPVPVYTIPANHTIAATTPPVTYTRTVVSTVCPGVNYCYATTVTSTYCPYSTTAVSMPYVPATTYAVTGVPYVPIVTGTPSKNVTVPSYTAPAVNPNGASGNQVSFGVLALAAVAGLFIAA